MRETMVLIGISRDDRRCAGESLDELAAFCGCTGAEVVGRMVQRRKYPDPSTYFGSAGVKQVKALVDRHGADTLVADTELAPGQRKNLENAVGVKVIDRTAVVLDLFGRRAVSRQARVDVELAQLEYLLPRVDGWNEWMFGRARGQTGDATSGPGCRKPGLIQIQLDDPHIRMRMARLRKLAANHRILRENERESRARQRLPSVAVTGYTNAGKTSLTNTLTSAELGVEDTFFTTVDPAVLRADGIDRTPFTCTDTIGFIQRLPHQLVGAYRSTLEEISFADVILHVVEADQPHITSRLAAMRAVFAEVGAQKTPQVLVMNKADLIDDDERNELHRRYPDEVFHFVSSVTGEGLTALRTLLTELLPAPDIEMDLLVPYDRGDVLSRLHIGGRMLSADYRENGALVRAVVRDEDMAGLAELAVRTPADRGAPTVSRATAAPDG